MLTMIDVSDRESNIGRKRRATMSLGMIVILIVGFTAAGIATTLAAQAQDSPNAKAQEAEDGNFEQGSLTEGSSEPYTSAKSRQITLIAQDSRHILQVFCQMSQ